MGSNQLEVPKILLKSIDCKQAAVRNVRFNVDGQYCLTCGSDKSLKLWNPYKCLFLKSYSGHGYEVLDARSSCDNGQIASCGFDKSIIIWDVTSGTPLKRYRGHAGVVNCVVFNEDSSVVISGSLDGSVKVWDVKSQRKEPIQTLNEARDSVTSIQISDHEILSCSADCYIRRYDIRNGKLIADCVGQPLTSVNFTKDGQCILVSCMNSSVKLFDKETGELLGEYSGHKQQSYRIDSCFSSSDTMVLSGSEDGKVYCWDLIDNSFKTTIDHPGCRIIHSLSFHPTRNFLLTAAEGQIYLWGINEFLDDESQ